MLAALTASLVGHRQQAGAPPGLATERGRPSPPPALAGMDGLLAAVQASSSGEGSRMDIPAPAMQGAHGRPPRSRISLCLP